MHPTFFILPLVALVPIAFYFYFYIRGMATFWGKDPKAKAVKIIGLIVAVLLYVLCHSFFSIGFFTIVHILVLSLIMALINLIYRKIKGLGKNEGKTCKDSGIWGKIYGCRLVPIVLAAACMIYGYFNMTNVIQKDYTVETDKSLKQDYKVAMIADLHMGVSMDVEMLEKHCQEIQTQNPDLVVLAGDLVDENTSKEYMEGACKAIGSIKAKYGIYYIWGNHDATQFIWPPDYTVKDLEENLKANGIKELQDETVLINGDINIIGRKDSAYMLAKRKSVADMMKTIDAKKFTIVLDHQPTTVDETSKTGADLQLSGHTHAGQLWPLGLLSEAFGLCDLNEGQKQWGDMNLIVSSGIAGFGSPIRTESHSAFEIIKITGEK